MTFVDEFLASAEEICRGLDREKIDLLATEIEKCGRLFFIGVGGSAANCSHAVNDFRKLCGIEAYAPADNVAELTARTNDEGWHTVFVEWLKVSNLCETDALFVLSVGGGSTAASFNIVNAATYAKDIGAKVFGIVGKDSGYTARYGDVVIVIPETKRDWVTPMAETFQAMVWHCLVNHPTLRKATGG